MAAQPPPAQRSDVDETPEEGAQQQEAPERATPEPDQKGGRDGASQRPVVPGIALAALCLIWMIPTIGLLISSFREEQAVKSTGWWTVFANPLDFGQWTLDNYATVIADGGLGTAFINTVAVSVPATIIPILTAAFAAYAFAWMDFRGRELLFIIVIGLLVVPLQVSFIPLLRIYGNFGLTGTFAALWLAHTGYGMPLAVYLLRNYMGSLPREVVESAKVDGASHFQVFWRLMIPLSVPVLAAFAILQFLWVWNDLLIAKLFLSADNTTVIVELQQLLGTQGQGQELLTAGAFISMIVPMIVFFTLQRYFVRGLTAGAVKG